MKVRKNYQEIYFLPSLFTLTNLFFGFMSIHMSIQGRFRMAALWIIAAAIMDGFDGIIARATKSQSEFGIELDSLSDAVSFGLAASLLIYLWGLSRTGAPGLFFSFIFLAAAVLRLARYNVRTKAVPDRRFYQGLTVPSAAMFLAGLVFYGAKPVQNRETAFLLAVLTLFIAFFMISTLPYRNFTNLFFRHRIDIRGALFLAIIVCGLIFYPRIFILGFVSINVISGPVVAIARALKKGAHKKPTVREVPS
ncbi:MAG: CDP-diacylglycerol--serine O-phosphatidyltransferase [Candidatus Aminicenantales bacterium]